MRHRIAPIGLALLLAASTARADIAPEPDHGPQAGSAGGLDFAIQSFDVEMGPANGPHYHKTLQGVVLTGCTDGHPNCTLAKSRHLIGREVLTVDGHYLRPDIGRVQQIIDAFADKTAGGTIAFEFPSRAANTGPVKIVFARR